MNFNRILVISFIVLVISTYQADSGIILAMLLKVLLLKGALFLSGPLAIGSFMMGQGMGFFSGNMMGGYMMLRAANRYHHKEKTKWTSQGSGGYGGGYGGGGGYGHGHGHGFSHAHYGGWGRPKFHKAYDKGKDIGSALHALTSHKTKIASALHKVKGLLGHGQGWKSPPPFYKGWGWNQGGNYHTAYTNPEPVTTKYKLYPYGQSNSGTSSYDSYGHGSKGYGDDGYESDHGHGQDGEVLKGQLDYSNFYPPTSVNSNPYNAQETSYSGNVQDPANTYYTSAYEGPGHEYTGILTDNKLLEAYLQSAQEKSSEEGVIYKGSGRVKSSAAASSLESSSTVAPNPLLEKYLEKRLEEEALKQKDMEKQEETKQLIQLLRKAYLKQLVESLKEEEGVSSAVTSKEALRDSRSIEHADSKNIIHQILYHKFPTSEEIDRKDDMISSPSGIDNTSIMNNETDSGTSTEKPSNFTTSGSSTTPRSTDTTTSKTQEITTTSTSASTPASVSTSSTTDTSYSTESSIYNNYETTLELEESTPNGESEYDVNDFIKMPTWIRMRRSTGDQIESPQAQAQSEDGAGTNGDAEKQIASFVDDIKKFFTLLTVLDQDQCLQKLVCDVHTNQKDVKTLTQYEQNILTTFRLMKALMPEGEEDSSTKYRRAALIGETGQSLELCQQSYASCGFSSNQIITLGSQAEATADDWTGAEAALSGSGRSDFVTMPRVRRTLRSFHL